MSRSQKIPQVTWRSLWKQKKFRSVFLLSLAGLLALAIGSAPFFNYIEQRHGSLLTDPILELFPPADVSMSIFILLYAATAVALVYLAPRPLELLTMMQAFFWTTVFRFTSLLLFPLNPPALLVHLNDPILAHFFYPVPITKDLFFSGHTSLAFILFLCVRQPWLRAAFLAITLVVGALLMIQHVHYSIDVLAAPLFTWLAYEFGRALLKRFGYGNV